MSVFLIVLLVLLVGVVLCGLFSCAQALKTDIFDASRDPLSYQDDVIWPRDDRATRALPRWHDQLDPIDPQHPLGGYVPPVTDGLYVYYLKRGQLIAADPLTGKRRWKYGAGLGPALAFNAEYGLLAVGGADGRVHIFQAGSEKRMLLGVGQSGLKGVQHLFVAEDVYTGNGNRVVALDQSGKRRWSFQKGKSGQVVAAPGNAVIYEYISDAAEGQNIAALEIQGGSLLWERSSVEASLLGEEADTFAIWTSGIPAQLGPGYTVEFVDALSGKTTKTLKVTVPTHGDCEPPTILDALLNNDSLWLFVQDECGRYHVRFLRALPGSPPLVYDSSEDQPFWLAGPYEDKVFVTTNNGQGTPVCLMGVSLDSLDTVTYDFRSLDPDCISISSLNIVVGGLYVGLADGQFVVFDVRTGQPLLDARLDARALGPTLVVGGAAVLAADDQVVGFALPPALR